MCIWSAQVASLRPGHGGQGRPLAAFCVSPQAPPQLLSPGQTLPLPAQKLPLILVSEVPPTLVFHAPRLAGLSSPASAGVRALPPLPGCSCLAAAPHSCSALRPSFCFLSLYPLILSHLPRQQSHFQLCSHSLLNLKLAFDQKLKTFCKTKTTKMKGRIKLT